MSPWINYHHLYYFKTIVEEGTVSAAAEKLRIGQPTLSAQLKQFEESMGIPLFVRKSKRLVITEQGKIAYEYAQNIFRMGSEMYEVLHDRFQPTRPHLHVGALDSVPKQIILKLVIKADRATSCQVTLSEGRFDELIRELSTHKMDLVISNIRPKGAMAKGLYPKLISSQNIAFYGAEKFRNLKRGFPDSISGVPMVLPTYDSQLRLDLDHWAKLHGIELNMVTESQDVAMKKLLAVDGFGLLAAAPHTVERQVRQKELYQIGQLSGVTEELYLISAQRKVPNPVGEKIINTFRV